MSAHTPGPWELLTTLAIEKGAAPSFATDAAGVEIANGACDVRIEGDNAPANARLIAAAPDLLSTLKDVLDCLDLAEKHDDLPLPFAGYGRAFIDKARAAIAKAKGAA